MAQTYLNEDLAVEGPYTNVNITPGSHWYGKETNIVYDVHGVPVCHVQRIYHYDRDGKLARALSSALSKALTEVGFRFNSVDRSWSIGPEHTT